MGPTTPPPWRLLDAPGDPDTAGAEGRRSGAGGDRSSAGQVSASAPPWTRFALTVVAAIGFAAIAIGLALSNGSGVVTVDGAAPLASTGTGEHPGAVASDAPDGLVVVEIVGAVQRPGVYRLGTGARLGDLIAAAGGYGRRVDAAAAERSLNLASALHDGDQVRVPSRDDATVGGAAATAPGLGGTGSTSDPGSIDLNTATAAQLDALPGIGPVTADKIIAAREQARFASPDELRTRGVLGEKTFERIRALVVVR